MTFDMSAIPQQARDLSLKRGVDAVDAIYANMQRGLVYPAPFAHFITFFPAKDDPAGTKLRLADVQKVVKDARAMIHEHCGSSHTTAVVGVAFPLWRRWCEEQDKDPPKAMRYVFPTEDGDSSSVFQRSSGSFQDSGGVLWFHVKSLNEAHAQKTADWLKEQLHAWPGIDAARTVDQSANSRSLSEDQMGGKILGKRFSENLNNPADPINIARHALVGYDDPAHLGASFALSQRLLINWDQLHNMSPDQIEDMIGRREGSDIIVPTTDDRTHIKSARIRNKAGNTTPVLRLGLPFGSSPFAEDPLAPKGFNRGDEAGIYFAGFSKDVAIMERIMNQMIGDLPTPDDSVEGGFMRDRVFNNVKSNLGGFFYIPCRSDLGLALEKLEAFETRNWERFPGVDWSRLDRHFQTRSANGRMFYNHKDYLYVMSTASGEQRQELEPPSYRILELLAVAFSLWQDNWYFNRKQQEIGHLKDYVAVAFGEAEAEKVMAMPIAERKGWATRMSLRLFASAPYGVRGPVEVDGKQVNGADTFHIHPMEIIVGGMPNLSLGQGCYVMRYLNDAETFDGLSRGLSEASGVGHVIPDHEKLLRVGLGGLRREVDERLAQTSDPNKQAFYRGVAQALLGVTEYCSRYAALARDMATDLAANRLAEKHNLETIAERMDRLAEEAPTSFTDAVQLIYTMHVCLHLSHEPVSLGRLDQLLNPFFEADMQAGRIDEPHAQEVLDAFWIKIGEKIQQNRMFVEDHQPTGNMAMGGSGGPYPQGSSNNQWLMQLTVGGTVADDSPGAGKPAYNTVTKLCLRASRRLPLNAPCLSLRTRKDMPADIREEAVKAILSGGAHPIFMNDEKLIPALHVSGDGVGGEVTSYTKGHWHSKVALASARNYACDGCYEPQFPGENWFTLAGGFTTLNPLEAALNKGRLYAEAGPTYFTGKNASFNSRDPADITSFEDLYNLYFEHFNYMFTTATMGVLGGYGALAAFCPGPLLSSVMNDCLAKGRDYYDGGTRYNIVGPEFIAVSSTVNSLWAIKTLVFNQRTAITSLPELVDALRCNWGHNMVEPFYSSLAGEARIAAKASRFKRLRQIALGLPRYGRGHKAIDAFGDQFLIDMAKAVNKTFKSPIPQVANQMKAFAEGYGTQDHPFGIQIQPGVGTFEGFVDFGHDSGASADGRLNREAIASDLSPSPSPMDQPPQHQPAAFLATLAGYTGKGTEAISDGAPVDVNIVECYPPDKVGEAVQAFAEGAGSNILTITVADPKTMAEACVNPEKYDLLRVRMGGWSEFFIAMFPYNQNQHLRRPLNVPDTDQTKE